MSKTIHLEECDLAGQNFFEILGDQSDVILGKDGKLCYFLGKIDEFQAEVFSLSQNQEFMNYLAQCRQRCQTEERRNPIFCRSLTTLGKSRNL